jgi:methionine aminopeptidase
MNTEEINSFVHRRTLEYGAIPSPLNYKGYPKSVCVTSGLDNAPYQSLRAYRI